jgi:hypothetical protein
MIIKTLNGKTTSYPPKDTFTEGSSSICDASITNEATYGNIRRHNGLHIVAPDHYTVLSLCDTVHTVGSETVLLSLVSSQSMHWFSDPLAA